MTRSIESYLQNLYQSSAFESAGSQEDPIAEMLADREAEMNNRIQDRSFESVPEEPALPFELIGNDPGQISNSAYNLIVAYETGGQKYYENVYKSAPCWPGYSSGITIGFGFDLGYYSEDKFFKMWDSHLSDSQLNRLKECIGFKTTEPGRSSKVEKARRWIRTLSDIKIPWSVGETVYTSHTVPDQMKKTLSYLPEAAQLPSDCFGALVSLVFNRGASFNRQGSRYREMRAIKELLQKNELDRIPAQFRSMKRLWTSSGLRKRRDEEAELFEQGLQGGSGLSSFSDRDENFDSFALDSSFSGANGAWKSVYWARNDANQPDYRHIAGLGDGETVFPFTASDLELLLAANCFSPEPSPSGFILFALRGCALQGGESLLNQASLPLVELRPDHRNFRCVVGVYNTESRALSAFTGSTVPNAHFVWNHKEKGNAGNLLPTGCYRYKTGSHAGKYPQCLLVDHSLTVLRSDNDTVYGTKDRWEKDRVYNNIHPSFGTFDWGEFSSAGGITVQGSYDEVSGYSGPWKQFVEAAGITGDGQQFHLVLLTGLEARLAAGLSQAGKTDVNDPAVVDALCRLRSGSKGEKVERLQEGLGVSADGDFGAGTRLALAKEQLANDLTADAIYSTDTEGILGFGVFPKTPFETEESPLPMTVPVDVSMLHGDTPPTDIVEFPPNPFETAGLMPPDEDSYIPEIFESADDGMYEGVGTAYWPNSDINSPSYHHLVDEGEKNVSNMDQLQRFQLGVEEMECLIRLNRFEPKGLNDTIAFGIRGATIRHPEGMLEKADSIPMEAVKPNHRNFRCVLGFYFQNEGRFSAYTASTVPWYRYMESGSRLNMLPTGCYIYKVGMHSPPNTSRHVLGLRLSDSGGAWSGPATVLRTNNDNCFGLQDFWDKCAPGDNVHCAYSNSSFSSLGCQTVKGTQTSGQWKRFQKTIKELKSSATEGIPRVDYVLLTGVEVSLAHHLLSGGASESELQAKLGRIRTGSLGEEVKKLQRRLGISPDGYFGAGTKKKFTEHQSAHGLPPDGILSPRLDQSQGWGIFDSPEPEPAPAGDTQELSDDEIGGEDAASGAPVAAAAAPALPSPGHSAAPPAVSEDPAAPADVSIDSPATASPPPPAPDPQTSAPAPSGPENPTPGPPASADPGTTPTTPPPPPPLTPAASPVGPAASPVDPAVLPVDPATPPPPPTENPDFPPMPPDTPVIGEQEAPPASSDIDVNAAPVLPSSPNQPPVVPPAQPAPPVPEKEDEKEKPDEVDGDC